MLSPALDRTRPTAGRLCMLAALCLLVTAGVGSASLAQPGPLPLVGTVYALVQAAGDQVETGRFTSEEALEALDATLASALRPPTP